MAQASTIITILGALTTLLSTTRLTAQSAGSPLPESTSGAVVSSTQSAGSPAGMHTYTPTLYLSCPPTGTRTIPLTIYNDDQKYVRTGAIQVSSSDSPWLAVYNGAFTLGYQLDLETSQIATVQVDGRRLPPGRTDAYLSIASDDSLNPSVPVHLVVYVQPELPLQPVNCVVEESTGTWCAECPEGERWLDDVKQHFGERAIILSYHGYDTLTIPEGQTILTQELGFTAYPLATVMRRLDPRFNRIYYMSDWATPVGKELAARPYAAAAIKVLAYAFDPATRHVSATISITSNDPIQIRRDSIVALTTYLVEDSLITPQREHIGGSQFVNHDAYVQRNVVRMIWPDRFGLRVPFGTEQMDDDLVKPGSAAVLRVEFDADGIADPTKTKIAFVANLVDTLSRGSTIVPHLGEILQGIEMPLTSSVAATVEEVAGTDQGSVVGEIRPNPARSEAAIALSLGRPEEVELRVIDLRGEMVRHISLGRLEAGKREPAIAVDGLPNGLYAVIVHIGGESFVRRLLLMR